MIALRRPPSGWSDQRLWGQVKAVYLREPQPGPFPQDLLDQLADPRFDPPRRVYPRGDVWRYAVVFDLDPELLPRRAVRRYPRDDYGRLLRWIAWRHHWEPDGQYPSPERWTRRPDPDHAPELCRAWVGQAGEEITIAWFRSGTSVGMRFEVLVRGHEDFGIRPSEGIFGTGSGGLPRDPWSSFRPGRWRPFR